PLARRGVFPCPAGRRDHTVLVPPRLGRARDCLGALGMNAIRWGGLALLLVAIGVWRPGRIGQWLTRGQQGERHFRWGALDEAAKLYTALLRQGIAWYRAGDFKSAERAFARDGSAEGAYDRGNSLVMLGKYEEAIQSYDRALQLRPHWQEAADNRALAK